MFLYKGLMVLAKLVLVMLLFIGLSQFISSVATAETEPAYLAPLLEKAQASGGTVRVIIRLDVPVRPQGNLTASQRASQRARIRNAQDDLLDWIDQFWWQNPSHFKTIPFIAVEVDQNALLAAATFPGTVKIMEDRLLKPDQLDPSLLAPELSQSIPLIGGVGGEFNGFSGAGQAIAILDTGVDTDHTFFPGGKVVREACFSTTGSGGTTVCPNGSQEQIGTGAGNHCDLSIDGCDHGTHVAGIAAGDGPSFDGVARDADIIAIQVFSRFSGAICNPGPSPCVLAFTSDTIDALEHVLDLHNDAGFTTPIAAANMSLGGGLTSSTCPGEPEQAAMANLRSVGIATVVAAGNDGQNNQISFPACIPEAISVGSTTKSDGISGFSNRDDFLDLMAPGSSIESSIPNDNFAFFNGTSMATPHVAGAFAVLHEAAPSSTVQEKLDALQNTGVTITDSGTGFTYKRIQLDAALNDLAIPPAIISFSGNDPDDGDTDYSAGDTLTIVFDRNTDQPAGSATQLFNFSDNIGTISGSWTSANTYTITVTNASGNGVSLGSTTVTPTGSPAIRSENGLSAPSSATSPALDGDLGLADVIWINDVNINVSGNNLNKITGNGWNSGATSLHTLASGYAAFEMTVNETNTNRMIGFSKGNAGQSFTEIDYAIYLHSSGQVYVYQNGTSLGIKTNYSNGDIIRQEINGADVIFRKNGVEFFTLSGVISGSSYPILIDTSLHTTGATLQDVKVSFGGPPPPPAAPVIASFVADDPDDGDVVYSNGDTLTITFDKDTNQPAGTPSQLFNFSANVGTVNGSWTSADTYTITVTDATGATIAIGSTTVTPTGSPAILDDTGTSAASSATSPVLSGDFGSSLQDVVWINGVNVNINGNSLTKTGGSGWSAGAVSSQSIASGDTAFEMTIVETNTSRMIGFSKGSSGQNFTEIDFAIYLHSSGQIYVFTNGTNLGAKTTYNGGDIIRQEISGSNVVFKKNGATFFTLSGVISGSSYPLLIDTSMSSNGGTLSNVKLEGGGPPPPPAAPVISSFVADDPDDGDVVYSNGDTLTITFDKDTNQPAGTPSQLFNFSANVGTVNGSWTSADTYTITVTNASGATIALGSTTVTPTGSPAILDDTGTSAASSATSPVLSGDFGSSLQDVVWVNGVNVNINGNSLTKTGGSGWSAGAVSSQTIASGDAAFEMTIVETNTSRMIGFSKGSSGQNFTEIDFAIYLHSSGQIYVFTNGTNLGAKTTYSSSDVIRQEISGTDVIFKKNGATFFTLSGVISGSSYPLLIDTSMSSTGSTLSNVKLEGGGPPPPPAAPVISSFVADDPDDGDVVYSNGDTLTITFDKDTNQPAGTPSQLFNFSANVGTVNGSWTSADTYTITVTDATGATIAIGSTTVTPTGSPAILDDTGTSAASSATSPVLSGDFGSSLQDVVWINGVNVNINGNSLTKTGGSGWSAGAVSSQSIASGDAAFEMTIVETNTSRMIGFSKGSSSQNFTEIDFAIYLHSSGQIYVFTNGTNLGAKTTYNGGDIIRQEISGSNVVFKKNGATFFTLSGVISGSSYPLLIDTSMSSTGSTLSNVKLEGGGPPPPPAAPVISSFVADDPDDGDVVYSNGDTLTITFDKDTNQPAGTPSQLFNFSANVGTVNGSWTSADTYTITVTDATGATIALGSTTVTPTGSPAILDDTGTSAASSTTSPVLSGDFGTSAQNVTWISAVNVNVSGNNLTKTGSNGWNGGAVSQQTITSGNGAFEVTVSGTNTNRMIGFSKGSSGQNFTEIDFAVYFHSSGQVYVFTNGTSLGAKTSYSNGDVIRQEISGTDVIFKKNGATFFTLSGVISGSSYPLLIDTSMHTVGGTLNNVTIEGASGGAVANTNPVQLNASTDIQSFVADGSTTGVVLSATFVDENGIAVGVPSGTPVTFSSTLFPAQTANTDGGATATANIIFSAPVEPEAVVVTATTTFGGVADDTFTLFFNAPGVRATEVAETNFTFAGTHRLQVNTPGIRSITITKGAGVTPVTTAKFDNNPAGSAPFSALGYYDVHLDNPAGVTQLVVEFCPATLPPGVFFWKNNAWKSVSNQKVVDGCVQVTIHAGTFPNLSDLSGQFFGVGANVTGGDPPIWENIMAFPTPEKSLGEDLNHDGDLLDTVLRYKDIDTGRITNTGIAVSGRHRDVDIYEDTIVFVEESQYRANVVSAYNIKTGELKRTGAIGYRPTIYGNIVSISGDTLRFYNLDTGVFTDTGIPGHIQALWGHIIAYHRAVVKTSHPTIRYYDIERDVVVNTKVAGHYPAIYENLIVFTSDERLIEQDLNGDGDALDSVVRYYDINTKTLHNTRQVGVYPTIHGKRIVFSTNREVRYYDLESQQTFTTSKLGTEPDIYGDIITYYLWEQWPLEDLNGDGDQSDPVVRTYRITDSSQPESDQDVAMPHVTPLHVQATHHYSTSVSGESDLMNFAVTGEGIHGMEVDVYDLTGNRVFSSGLRVAQLLQWDLTSKDHPVANGVYLYVLRVQGMDGSMLRSPVRKLMILR